MAWTGAGAVGVIERVMSRLLERERFGQVVGKGRHLLLAVGVAIIIVLSVLAGSKATNLQSRLGFGDPLSRWAFAAVSISVTAAVCTALYHLCPREGLPWRAAAFGAAPAAVVLWLTPTVAAYYLGLVAGTTPVHVFLVLAGILFTCYLVAMTLLLGAALAVRRARQG
jgi:uncharacterized BrkB/YihY/UPF0761 family membrane protein